MLTVAENPRRRARRRHRRNPDGTFAGVNNPRRKRRTYRRRRNPASNPVAVASNPVDNPRRRRRRSNPFGLEKATQQLYGVGLEEMAGGMGGLVGTSVVGEMLNENFNKDLPVIPTGQSQVTGPSGVVNRDLMYIVRRTAPHALAAAGLYFLAKALGLKRDVVAAVGVTGGAATLAKAIAASDIAPQIASEGSLRLGTRGAIRQLPPPLAPMGSLERTTETVTVIP